MKSSIFHIFSSIFVIGTTILFCICFKNNLALENRLDTHIKYNHFEKEILESEKSFKEDFYINHQNRDTTLILTCFAVGFILFSFFTFKSVEDRFTTFTKEINAKYEIHENDYKIQHKKLIKLENDLNYQIAMNYEDIAEKYLGDNKYNKYIIMSLCSLEKYSFILQNSYDENETFKESTQKIINDKISLIHSLLDNTNYYLEEKDLEYERFRTIIDTILKQLDAEHFNMLNFIISKIKFL